MPGAQITAAALLDQAHSLAGGALLRADVVEGRTEVARARGEIADWLDVCREEADRVVEADPRRASLLLYQVWDYVSEQYDAAAGRVLLDRMIGLSSEPDDDVYLVQACAWQAMLEDDVVAARAATRRGLELGAGRSTERALEFGYELVYLGDSDAARGLLKPLIMRFRSEGSLLDLAKALTALAALECRLGRLASAEAAGTEAVSLAEEAGLSYWVCDTLSVLCVVEALLGKESASAAHAQRLLELWPRVGLRSVLADAWHALGLSSRRLR